MHLYIYKKTFWVKYITTETSKIIQYILETDHGSLKQVCEFQTQIFVMGFYVLDVILSEFLTKVV